MPEQTKELVTVQSQYMALQKAERTAEVVKKTFGNKGISLFDLERVKLPTGGSTQWSIHSETGQISNTQKIQCLIPYMRNDRTYWADSFESSGGGSPPACTSIDLINQVTEVGHGDNGTGQGEHRCDSCPQNAWGSDPRAKAGDNGKKGGKACRESWILFLLREGREQHLFPSVLVLTPGSLKAWRGYNTLLTSQGLYYATVLHELELVQARSKGGITFAEVKPSMVRKLTDDECAAMEMYENAVRSSFGGVRVQAEDVASTPE